MRQILLLFATIVLFVACDDGSDGGGNSSNVNNTSNVNNENNTGNVNNVVNVNNATAEVCDNGMDDDGDGDVDCADTDCLTAPACDRWLYVEGNAIRRADGSRWVGHGANLHDTRSCNRCAWNTPVPEEVMRRADALVEDWGADFIRLLLEAYPSGDGRVSWQTAMDDPDYLADMIAIVEHIGQHPGVYVLISLWIDPSFDDLGWPADATVELWRLLVQQFAQYPHVLFGVVNEPQSNFDGSLDADCHAAMSAVVEAIREEEELAGSPYHLVAVQGTRGWGRTLDYYVTNPVTVRDGDNVVYETHVYNPESDFESQFVVPSATLPVIIGEFGPADGYMTMDDCSALMVRAEELHLPWLAWTFHQRCPPNLLEQADDECDGMALTPTAWGILVRDWLTGL